MTVLGRAVLGILALSLPVLADGQENANETELASVTLPSTEVCGKPSGRFNRIVGGSDAEPGMFPWIAAIGNINAGDLNLQPGLRFFCTGSLVTDWHLITTSWCVSYVNLECKDQGKLNPCKIVARFRGLDLNHVEPTGSEVDYELDTWKEHPYSNSYNWGGPGFDIGMMKMKKRVTFSRFIQPICLPVLSEFSTKNFTGSTGYISRWHWTKYDGQEERRLQQTQVRIWEQEKCQEMFKDPKIPAEDQFCAAGDDGSRKCEKQKKLQEGAPVCLDTPGSIDDAVWSEL